jgi:hypothetical protein
MTSEQTERMSEAEIEQHCHELSRWYDETGKVSLRIIMQYQSDLAEAREQLEEAREGLEFYVHQGDMGERARTILSRLSPSTKGAGGGECPECGSHPSIDGGKCEACYKDAICLARRASLAGEDNHD